MRKEIVAVAMLASLCGGCGQAPAQQSGVVALQTKNYVCSDVPDCKAICDGGYSGSNLPWVESCWGYPIQPDDRRTWPDAPTKSPPPKGL